MGLLDTQPTHTRDGPMESGPKMAVEDGIYGGSWGRGGAGDGETTTE